MTCGPVLVRGPWVGDRCLAFWWDELRIYRIRTANRRQEAWESGWKATHQQPPQKVFKDRSSAEQRPETLRESPHMPAPAPHANSGGCLVCRGGNISSRCVESKVRNLATDFSLQQLWRALLHFQQTANTWRPTHHFNRAETEEWASFSAACFLTALKNQRCHLWLICNSQEFKQPVYSSSVPPAEFCCRFRGKRKREEGGTKPGGLLTKSISALLWGRAESDAEK